MVVSIGGLSRQHTQTIRLFLCGDVMLGRGIDQVLAHPCDPTLHEDYAHSALDYVRLAEEANGPIERPVAPAYIWGAALEELARAQPHLRVVNLETSITRSEDYEPKGINYRMSPENADCLRAAGIDCCVVANNHILDWRRAGLLDTLGALKDLHIKTAGAGRDRDAAATPAVFTTLGGRVVVHSFASPSSGTPSAWAADAHTAGVNFLPRLSDAGARAVIDRLAYDRRPGDITIVSIHWGPNWGYDVLDEERRFAHALIDDAGVAIVHGHSSHHPRPIEIYRDRLILYGCGDFLNDYEGVAGYEHYRGDLALMYFADVDAASGALAGLTLVPLQIRNFRLQRPGHDDIGWLYRTLSAESGKLGTTLALTDDQRLSLEIGRPTR